MSVSRVSSVGSAVSRAAVMFVSVPSGTTRRSAPRCVKPTSMLFSMLRKSTAPVKTAPLQMPTAASSRSVRALRRPRFCRARLPSRNLMPGPSDFGHRLAAASYGFRTAPQGMSTLAIASPVRHRPLQRARTGVLHMLELGGDDDAIMVTAAARQNAQQLICGGVDAGHSARQPLKAAERREQVFAVIGYGRRLQVWPDTLDFLLDCPGLGVHHHDAARRRRRMQDRQIELRAVQGEHHMERVRILAAPKRVFD